MFRLLFKDFIFRRKTLLTMGSAFLLCCCWVFFLTFVSNHKKQQVLTRIDQTVQAYQMILESEPNSKETVTPIIDQLLEQKQAVEQEEWEKLYDLALTNLSKLTNNHGSLVLQSHYALQRETFDMSEQYLSVLKQRNLPYGFPYEFVYTAFERPTTTLDKQTVEEYTKPQLTDSRATIWSFLQMNSLWIFIAIGCLLFADMWIYHRTWNHPTQKWMLTEGVSFFRMYFSKLLFYTSSMFAMFIGVFLLIILIAGIFHGFGTWDYPFIHYYTKSTAQIIALSSIKMEIVPFIQIFIPTVGILFTLIVFWTAVIHFFVSLTSHPIVGSLIGLTIGGLSCLWYHPWNPWSYWNVTAITEGSAMVQMGRNYWNNPWIIPLMWGITILLYVIIGFIEKYHSRH